MTLEIKAEAYTEYVFFWRSHDPFSMWHPSQFQHDGIAFNCAEQFMMYHKAMLFKDRDTANRILATSRPAEHRSLGREVKGFQEALWLEHRLQIVYDANYHKFTQNDHLLDFLLSTQGKLLVEASPEDLIWGIGLKEDDPRARDPNQWRGQNLMGIVITQLREDLANDE